MLNAISRDPMSKSTQNSISSIKIKQCFTESNGKYSSLLVSGRCARGKTCSFLLKLILTFEIDANPAKLLCHHQECVSYHVLIINKIIIHFMCINYWRSKWLNNYIACLRPRLFGDMRSIMWPVSFFKIIIASDDKMTFDTHSDKINTFWLKSHFLSGWPTAGHFNRSHTVDVFRAYLMRMAFYGR